MISLHTGDSRPLYEQILEEFTRLILTGALPPDSKLPSVRELAARLAINANTIQRAYRELENEGYLYSSPGKGSFVAQKAPSGKERWAPLLNGWRSLTQELLYWGMPAGDMIQEIREMEERA